MRSDTWNKANSSRPNGPETRATPRKKRRFYGAIPRKQTEGEQVLQKAGRENRPPKPRQSSAGWHPALALVPCYRPLQAWRTVENKVSLTRQPPPLAELSLPCGRCIGCRMAAAKSWSLRCRLELMRHEAAAFVTLTYDQANLPSTLEKRDLQLFFKRLRKANGPFRFFACGEYGERGARPHYHGILFGIHHSSRDLIGDTWGLGRTHTGTVTPDSIAYVAGYTFKKCGVESQKRITECDEDGVVTYEYQPPFIQMSRRPGIGGDARSRFTQSWRSYAVLDGVKMPVPRFLHEAWKNTATPQEALTLQKEKALGPQRETSETQRKAAEQIAIAKQNLRRDTRRL